MNNTALLRMENIHKRFPGVYALDNVSIDLFAGEVLALLGENGAGKSTLIKILGGIYQKDNGKIEVDGLPVEINSVADARKSGISIIHQELVLVPHLSVFENIFLGREIHQKNGLLDSRKMIEKCQEILNIFGIQFSPQSMVFNLTIAQQQMVEIAKAISFNSKIIVMDEPTSSLSDNDVELLFSSIETMKSKGIGIIYISHRMSELNRIADRVSIMRDGKVVATKIVKKTNNEELISLMVGRDLGNYYYREHQNATKKIVLQVNGLCSSKVKDISFDLHEGEILGFGGLVGCGRTETMLALFGIDKRTSGTVVFNGEKLPERYSPADMIDKGCALVPENRRDEGLFPIKSVQYNLTLKVLGQFMKGLSFHAEKEDEIYDQFVKNLAIKVASPTTPINSLSGGNQQKVIIASWLASNPKVLILDEPTRGIDVGSKSEIYHMMNALTSKGVSIIMISSELPELINMSDRIAVLCDGQISAILERDEISQEKIMQHAIRY